VVSAALLCLLEALQRATAGLCVLAGLKAHVCQLFSMCCGACSAMAGHDTATGDLGTQFTSLASDQPHHASRGGN
jgi:hypothetical protein